MFSKHSAIKPINKKSFSQDGYICNSQYVNLSNNRVMLIVPDSKHEITTLKIFSGNDLKKPITETSLYGKYIFLGATPDSFILFELHDIGKKFLVRFCSDTLEMVSAPFPEKKCDFFGIIDNSNFFFTRKDDFCDLTIHQLNGNKLIEVNGNTKLSLHPHLFDKDLYGIRALGENQFAWPTQNNDTKTCGVLIFYVDPETYDVKELGLIDLTINNPIWIGILPAVCTVTLPKGQLLTYNIFCSHKEVQIWDIEKLCCVKEWKWKDIQTPKNFSPYHIRFEPLPDSKYLLVYHPLSNSHMEPNGTAFYLFNTDNLILKKIKLESTGIRSFYLHHVLPKGQILIFASTKKSNFFKIKQFDIPEIASYRKRLADYRESKYICSRFFNSKLNEDISKQILSYAFTSDVKESFTENCDDEKSNCLIM